MIRRDHGERPSASHVIDHLSELAMNMNRNPLLAQELENRFMQLPVAERQHPFALVRTAVELTRDLMKDSPESVDDFLRMLGAQQRSVN